MSQDVTLSDVQRQAIALLLEGKRDAEVGEALGVTRETVNRWRNGDDAFTVELNKARRELWGGHMERLRSLVGRALEELERELGCEHAHQVAVQILKAVGLYGNVPAPSGATTLGELERQRELARKVEAQARMFEELF